MEKLLDISLKVTYYSHRPYGAVAERSKAAVLKTVDLHGSGGSNPPCSEYKYGIFAIWQNLEW